jgi:fructokinase
MPDVITFGELLIDFVPTISNVSLIDAPAFKKAPGGAPANVAVGLSRLGVSTGFMGKVGDDAFGHFLAKVLSENEVDTRELCYSDQARTALAFVSLGADGEREFMFYRHPSADMLHRPEEINIEYIKAVKIFHFGSISLISEPSRSATFRAVNAALDAGLLVSYDPNLRLSLWKDRNTAKQGMMSAWNLAHLIKVSEEEIEFLSGQTDISVGVSMLWHDRLSLLVVTKGKQGCSFFTKDFSGDVPGIAVEPVDTTGAGDGFVAGLLKGLLEKPNGWDDLQILSDICYYANAVGALTTTERGAIPALPYAGQVEQFLKLKPGIK